MTPVALILQIAAAIGCSAVVVPAGADPVDYAADNEAVIDALNETQADDRPAVDEAPWEDDWCWDREYLESHADDTEEQEVRETYNSLLP